MLVILVLSEVALWLVHLSWDRAVWVQALAGNITPCSLVKTLYFNAGNNPAMDYHIQRG